MKIIIDIDGTICEEKSIFERVTSKPIVGAIKSVNTLYDNGHYIIYYSSRGWQEFEVTKQWLDTNGFKYHQLILGKPIGEVWIDDRALQFTSWDDIMTKLNKPKDSDKIKELENKLSELRLKEINRLMLLDPDPESEDGKYLNKLATEQEEFEKENFKF